MRQEINSGSCSCLTYFGGSFFFALKRFVWAIILNTRHPLCSLQMPPLLLDGWWRRGGAVLSSHRRSRARAELMKFTATARLRASVRTWVWYSQGCCLCPSRREIIMAVCTGETQGEAVAVSSWRSRIPPVDPEVFETRCAETKSSLSHFKTRQEFLNDDLSWRSKTGLMWGVYESYSRRFCWPYIY